MQVKIGYTVFVEELPKEISRLLENVNSTLAELSLSKFEVTDDNLVQSMNKIIDFRSRLVMVDKRLSECYTLISSYCSTVANSYAVQADPPTEMDQLTESSPGDEETESNERLSDQR